MEDIKFAVDKESALFPGNGSLGLTKG